MHRGGAAEGGQGRRPGVSAPSVLLFFLCFQVLPFPFLHPGEERLADTHGRNARRCEYSTSGVSRGACVRCSRYCCSSNKVLFFVEHFAALLFLSLGRLPLPSPLCLHPARRGCHPFANRRACLSSSCLLHVVVPIEPSNFSRFSFTCAAGVHECMRAFPMAVLSRVRVGSV